MLPSIVHCTARSVFTVPLIATILAQFARGNQAFFPLEPAKALLFSLVVTPSGVQSGAHTKKDLKRHREIAVRRI
jgi:hypothetical protein